MIKKFFVLLFLVALAAFMIVPLILSYNVDASQLNTTAEYYAENGPSQVGAANLVTAVVVTYRGLDTLGEVTILFLTAAIMAFFLKRGGHESGGSAGNGRNIRPSSELLRTAGEFLTPFIFLLGAYVFVNGHLTPGGGFQGGAIMASGLVLMLLSDPLRKTGVSLFSFAESISGFVYVGIAVAGMFLAGGFLSNNILLPIGEVGQLVSAGVLPIIYILIGLKVGSELSGILANYQHSQEEAE